MLSARKSLYFCTCKKVTHKLNIIMRPYIICHMFSSIDGRIDCAMTEHISGNEYYDALDKLNAPTTLSGKTTAAMHDALPGKFEAKTSTPIGSESVNKAIEAEGYSIVTDTCGTLLWEDDTMEGKPLIVAMSEKASQEYLDYLREKGISWIVAGKEKIDLRRMLEILSEQFGVERMAVVGGGTVNGGFLAEGLIDEISVMYGAGVDGRTGQKCVFDGMEATDRPPILFHLESVERVEGTDVIWARYSKAPK